MAFGFFKKIINKIKGKKEGSIENLSQKIEEKNWYVRRRVQGLKYSSVARYFPSMYKALGSIPHTGKKKKRKKKG